MKFCYFGRTVAFLRVLNIKTYLCFAFAGADLGGGCRGCAPPPPPPEMTGSLLIQLVFCKKKKVWFAGVEVEQETRLKNLR